MRRLLALYVVILFALALPAGCVMSLALTGGAIYATSADECIPRPPAESAREEPSPSFSTETRTGVLASGPPDACIWPATFAGAPMNSATLPAPDTQAATSVAAALTAVGRGGRYVAEGNGPVDFDCSGLTAWAWRQAGVSLVDYSYTQRSQTRDIPRALVQPGDLVFWFGGDEHHVAIVVAVDGGQVTIAEAANPDAGLRVRQLGGGWDDAYLTGFGRVLRS